MNEGIPYAAPEAALLFKAKHLRDKDHADFQRVLNTLKVGDPVVLNVSRLARDQKGERLVPLIVQFTYQ